MSSSEFLPESSPASSSESSPAPTLLPDAPGFVVLRHYLLDLSVENPLGRLSEDAHGEVATEHLLDVVCHRAQELGGVERVDITVHLRALIGGRPFFIAELTHRVELLLHRIDEASVAEVLQVQVPETLTPVLANLLTGCGHFAGYPDMQVGTLDFAGAYAGRLAAAG